MAVAVLTLAAEPSQASADEDANWQPFEAQHFIIFHRPDHRPQAAWYAEFIERVYEEISDLFGSELSRIVAVRLYPTESAYVAANPAAAGVNGILAHARPNSDEIGLALVRLEQLPAALRIDAFRHELTHLVLTERSAGRLPVGLHEGLAQYAERDRKGHEQLMDGLRKAYQQRAILKWADLDRASGFYGRPDVSYPQSYSITAYLADRFGFGRFLALLDTLADGDQYSEAVNRVYGRSYAELEAEWMQALPTILAGPTPNDLLVMRELSPARRALEELRFVEAIERAGRAEAFWIDLGRPDRAAEARAIRESAAARLALQERAEQDQRLLTSLQYQEAEEQFIAAMALAAGLADEPRRAQLETMRAAAARGTAARESLEKSRTALETFRIPEARSQALSAYTSFAELGDDTGASEAREVLDEAQAILQRLGLGFLGTASLFGIAWWLGWQRRTRAVSQPAIYAAREEIAL